MTESQALLQHDVRHFCVVLNLSITGRLVLLLLSVPHSLQALEIAARITESQASLQRDVRITSVQSHIYNH
jgi:hypothetical protein